ncbi:hypothetical protein WN944_010539 [Citrus x changshan-huyou]|uniref:hAT-like transposase RNase-H fold domain-containing protein n=1 Tax=Citrus x changshan-huyou TaxID=2935761 RepID=A0AAP0MXI9_9ROSI
MDFVTWCFSNLHDTKKVEELCNSFKELLMKFYQIYNSGDPNSAAKISCMVQHFLPPYDNHYLLLTARKPIASFHRETTSTHRPPCDSFCSARQPPCDSFYSAHQPPYDSFCSARQPPCASRMVDNVGEVQKANNEVCNVHKKLKAANDAKQQTLVRKKGKGKDDGTAKRLKVFLEFMETCCPKFEVPSRRTIIRDILELYPNEKGLLKRVLSANKQRKRILTFTPISNHKGDGIGKLIKNCLIDWGIEKLFTITVDNASANTLAISYVKKKLVNWSGNSMVLNVKYVRSSPARLQKFKTCVDREKNSCGGLIVLDVPTLWNSTYFMLEKAIEFEKAFHRLKEEDDHYTNWFDEDESEKRRVGPPTDEDWETAKRFNMLLIVANVLDPRCKLDFVIWCFSSLYDIRNVDELRVNIKE